MFICFDMPLSNINKVQAQSINDLENYLMAKSIQSTISTHPNEFKEFESQTHPFEIKQRNIEFLTAEKPRYDEN